MPSSAHAAQCDSGPADRVWQGNVDQDWFNPANWAPPSLPTAATHVCVPASAATAPVIKGRNGTYADAASLESFRSISVNGGGCPDPPRRPGPSLGPRPEGRNLVRNEGALRIEGDLGWRNATISGAGSTTVAPGGTITSNLANADRRLSTQTLHLDGAGTFSGSGRTLLQTAAEIEIGPGGSLDLQGDQRIDGAGLVRVDAGGTLARSTGSTPAIIGAALDNDGTVSASAPSTAASPALSLRGGTGRSRRRGRSRPPAGP